MSRRSGACFVITSISDAPSFTFALVGLQLRKYTAYYTASPQNVTGSRLAKIMLRAMFRIVLCMRSALPFDA